MHTIIDFPCWQMVDSLCVMLLYFQFLCIELFMAKILPIQCKTLSNQSINQSIELCCRLPEIYSSNTARWKSMHALIDTVYSSRSTFFVYPNIPCINSFGIWCHMSFKVHVLKYYNSVGVISVKRISLHIEFFWVKCV